MVVTGVGVSPLIYGKVTGKTIGLPGSIAHMATNKNIDNKFVTKVEQTSKLVQNTASDVASIATIGGGVALATGCSNKVQSFVNGIKDDVVNVLNNIVIKGKGNKSLAEIIKSIPGFNKFGSLPLPAKAGIVAAVAVAMIALPLISIRNAAESAYIEGKHEIK